MKKGNGPTLCLDRGSGKNHKKGLGQILPCEWLKRSDREKERETKRNRDNRRLYIK